MKIVIIGGVAGGASAAARARRLDETAEIVLLQSGPDVSFASCGMPYFVGGEITDRHNMAVQTPASLHEKLNLDVRVNIRVTSIDTKGKAIKAKSEETGEEFEESFDHLVMAVGAAPFTPPIPGIDRPGLFSLRNLQDMDAIVAWIEKKSKEMPIADMHFVVAGAGFVGLEMVEQLVNRGANVTLVEMMPQVLGPMDVEMAILLQRDLEARGVEVVVGDAISEFKEYEKDPETSILTLKSGRVLPPAQLTILGLGVRPDTALAKEAGIELGPRGHIVVDDHLRTNVPGVWAVGDAIQVKNPVLKDDIYAVPLAGPANRQGRMAVDNIYGGVNGKLRSYKGTWGTSVVRSFEMYAACVGMNEKYLKFKNVPYKSVHIHPGSHAGYYPGAKKVHLKMLFSPSDGAILGAQAVGEDGIEKMIDIIATAMQGGLKVDDMAELELCYAPPVGSAKHVVNMAGMVAQNIMDGKVSQVEWQDLSDLAADEGNFFLDVRNPGEIEKSGKLTPSALNIPLGKLRESLDQVPKDKRIVVSCASGQRAYYAYRILAQNGYKVDNMAGGFMTSSTMNPVAK
eukprot:Nitzschia sp. Nitz4//scaffold81_size91200//56146//57852//NITZ4_004990-RA/size91200-processed-gene-0.129-mRNA-1//-1//CDS//3329558722//9002//frame0